MRIDSIAIVELQEKRGLTGKDLAAMAGMLPGSLSTLKRKGSTTKLTACRIARALGVSLEEITEKEQKGGEEA